METETVKPKTRPRGRPSRRGEIVAAAEQLLSSRGLAGVTTRAIAERVPCSEGAIYVHFENRMELMLAVLEKALPEMLVSLHGLRERAGENTPAENLEAAMMGLIQFHESVVVMVCSVVAESELKERFRQRLTANGERGPNRGIRTIADYIQAEQKLGRVPERVDAHGAAQLMMASSFFHVFTAALLGAGEALDVKRVVDTALGSKA